MDLVSALAGAATAVIGVLLGLVALQRKAKGWFKGVSTEVLYEVGLIRYEPFKRPKQSQWPNGWDTLPDALEGIYTEVRSHHERA